MKVKSVKYNWRQVGSTETRDGAGDDWECFTVGEKGVIEIEENAPHNGMELWNYVVSLEDGTIYRIFNPNFVEFFKEQVSKDLSLVELIDELNAKNPKP